jgi:hypothetical protein
VSVATPPAGGGAGGAGGYPIPTATPQPASEACPLCGSALDPEQEWCLRCGAAARTRLAASPSWKTPVIVLAAVIALSLGVLAAALVSLAGGSGHSTKAPVTVLVTAAPTTPTTAIPPTATVAPTTTVVPGTSTPTATPPSTTTAPGATTTSPSATTPGSTAATPGLTTPTSKSSPTTPKTTTTPSHTTTGTTPPASNPLVEESPKK